MDENKRNTIIRFAVIFLLMTGCFAAVLVKIVYTQTAEREELLQIAQRQVSRNETIRPNRGNIYDTKGNLLAGSSAIYYIRMDTRVQALHAKNGKLFKEKVDSVADTLSAYFKDKSAKEYKQMLTQAYNRGDGRLLLYPKRITYRQLKDVQQMPLFRLGRNKSGLIAEEGYQRVQPFRPLAARTIGDIYGGNGQGRYGLELAYEDVLCGKTGQKQTEMIDGRIITSADKEAEDGYDIVTTLDADLQDIVETQLLKTLQPLQADWGCCVLMEVKTGEIKAIANLGLNDGRYTEDQNYAVTRVEPGSTFKPISLMAILDDTDFDLDDTIMVRGKQWVYQDKRNPIEDSHEVHDPTLWQIIAASSNIGISKLVTRTYENKATRFVSKLDKMGIRDSIPFEIPGMQASRINVPSDKETLSRMSFGYYVELPPIAILTFYNAIANDGKMISPLLVKEIQHNGRTVEKFEASVMHSSICKSSTLKDIRKCLESVVWDNTYGTAAPISWHKRAQSDIVHIAGKTGTVYILENGRYTKNERVSFCGYFPMEDPQYTCICVIHKPRRGGGAGVSCGGTIREIAEKTMAYAGSIPVESRYADSIDLPPIKRGVQTAIRKAAKGTGVPIRQCEAEWVRINKEYAAEALNVSTDLVPNVIGMGAKDAVYAIEQTGMHARISGKGKAVSQSVQSGSKVSKGGIVYIELR